MLYARLCAAALCWFDLNAAGMPCVTMSRVDLLLQIYGATVLCQRVPLPGVHPKSNAAVPERPNRKGLRRSRRVADGTRDITAVTQVDNLLRQTLRKCTSDVHAEPLAASRHQPGDCSKGARKRHTKG